MTDKPYATGGIVPGGKPVIVGTGTLGHTDVNENPSCTGGVVPFSGPLLLAGPEMFLPSARTCKGCKHWLQFSLAYGECMMNWAPDGVCEPNGLRVACHDDHALHTGPDFGCVRWERKE